MSRRCLGVGAVVERLALGALAFRRLLAAARAIARLHAGRRRGARARHTPLLARCGEALRRQGVRLISGTPGGSVSTQAAKGALGAYGAMGLSTVWPAVGPGQAVGGPVVWACRVAGRVPGA